MQLIWKGIGSENGRYRERRREQRRRERCKREKRGGELIVLTHFSFLFITYTSVIGLFTGFQCFTSVIIIYLFYYVYFANISVSAIMWHSLIMMADIITCL